MSNSLRRMKREEKKKEKEKDLLRKLRWEKKIEEERKRIQEGSTEKTLLLKICGNDIELYYVLSRTMFINPERFAGENYRRHMNTARKYKKEGDLVRARKYFHIAAAIALYKGNLNYARQYFSVLSNLVDPTSELTEIYGFYLKEENLIKAMKTVKEFCDKSLKS